MEKIALIIAIPMEHSVMDDEQCAELILTVSSCANR
jgi:hypothetical protein